MTIETDKGTYTSASGENVQLPATFPKDVHLPADAEVTAAMTMGQALSVTLSSQQALSTAYDAYRKAQAADGWTETMAMQDATSGLLAMEKGQQTVLTHSRPRTVRPRWSSTSSPGSDFGGRAPGGQPGSPAARLDGLSPAGRTFDGPASQNLKFDRCNYRLRQRFRGRGLPFVCRFT